MDHNILSGRKREGRERERERERERSRILHKKIITAFLAICSYSTIRTPCPMKKLIY